MAKSLSGSQKRKRAALKKIEALVAQAKALGVVLVNPLAPGPAAGGPATGDLSRYQALGKAPAGAAGRVAWAGRVAAQLLEDTVLDPAIDEATRRRVGKDLVAVIGMTQAKANVDEQLAELRELLEGKKQADELTPSDGLDFPPTSRLGRPRPGDDETH